MSNTIKTNQIKILKLNNNTYLPYQLHQLPKYFDKYTTDFFNLKGYCYINLTSLKSHNKDIHTLNKDLDYKLRR